MYKEEIKDLYSKKRESYRIIIKDLTYLYFKLKIGYPNLEKEQNSIKYLINFYVNYDHDESDILSEINRKFGSIDFNMDIEDILDELDIIYNYYYSFIDNIINNYELVIDNNILRIIISRVKGNYISINNLRYKLTVPEIDKILDKEKIIKKIRSI